MYRHIKNYDIRFTDTDPYDNLKLSSLLSFLEESACLSGDELGFGYDAVSRLDIGFVVVNWYIELFRPVKLGSKFEIHTWPLKPAKCIFLRDYEIYADGEKVGVCTSRWLMVDLKSFSLLPTSAYFKEGAFDNYNTERSVDFKAWKIPPVSDREKVYTKKIMYSDYDHYFHANNTKYADYMLDAFSLEELDGKFLKTVQITYSKQCKIGEELDFYREDIEGFTVVDGKVGDEARVQFKVKFDEI